MSEVVIIVKKGRNFRTEVFVDDKFAYTTPINMASEGEHIRKLLEAMVVENVRVEVK